MAEFFQWVIFLGFIALFIIVIYLHAAGLINTKRTRTESFKEWQKYNGGVVRLMCILILIVCLSVGIYKYYQVQENLQEPPALETE